MSRILKNNIIKVIGIILFPSVWLILTYCINVPERYLPSPSNVISAFSTIEPNIVIHFLWSFFRLIVGYIGGVLVGIFLGLRLFKSKTLYHLLFPTIQSLRSIPAAATVPFFLLWFGFEETGKFLLIISGIAFNLSITTIEILSRIPDKYSIFFRSINDRAENHLQNFALPFVLEKLLPTLRFSLSTSIGLVVVSEFLGSQVGLGYLIQTARSTFSMNVIFACMLLFGVMNFLVDKLLITIWSKIIKWKS